VNYNFDSCKNVKTKTIPGPLIKIKCILCIFNQCLNAFIYIRGIATDVYLFYTVINQEFNVSINDLITNFDVHVIT